MRHFDNRIDEGLVRQINAAEFETVAFRGGFEGEGDFRAGVERGAFESGRAGEGVLKVSGGHEGGGLRFPGL